MSAHITMAFGYIVSLCWVLVLNPQDQNTTSIPEIVSVRISVRDGSNRFMHNSLTKENFRIYEDGIEQKITDLSQLSSHISTGILMDISASMRENNTIKKIQNAIVRFLRTAAPDNDYFLVSFNEDAQLAKLFTGQLEPIQSQNIIRRLIQRPIGSTALYDAIYLSLNEVKLAKYSNKALVLITDGEDNVSNYTPIQVREFAKELDVMIFGICKIGVPDDRVKELKKIVNLTGGRNYYPSDFSEVDHYLDLIHAELSNQYLISYLPTNQKRNGKWRNITVKLQTPPSYPKLFLSAREGYYAPKY
jgi:Ca-activated chloride channel homolog